MDELRRHRRWEEPRTPSSPPSAHNRQVYTRFFERLRSFLSLQVYSDGCRQSKEDGEDEEACPLSVVYRIRGCTYGREKSEKLGPLRSFQPTGHGWNSFTLPPTASKLQIRSSSGAGSRAVGGGRSREVESATEMASLLGQKLTDGDHYDEHLEFAEHEYALTVMRIDSALEGILGSCEHSFSTPMERTAWRSKRVHCRTTSTCRWK